MISYAETNIIGLEQDSLMVTSLSARLCRVPTHVMLLLLKPTLGSHTHSFLAKPPKSQTSRCRVPSVAFLTLECHSKSAKGSPSDTTPSLFRCFSMSKFTAGVLFFGFLPHSGGFSDPDSKCSAC